MTIAPPAVYAQSISQYCVLKTIVDERDSRISSALIEMSKKYSWSGA